MANFYLSDNVITTDVRWELLTSAEGDSSVTCSIGNGATEQFYFRSTAGIPGNADWETGGTTVYLTIDTGTSDVNLRARINRCDSGGTIQESTDWTTAISATAGDKNISIASKDWAAGNLSDLFELQLEMANVGKGGKTIVLSTGNASRDYIDASISITAGPDEPEVFQSTPWIKVTM